MITDFTFYLEIKLVKKVALLVVIPCAILPIMMAAAGIMSIPFTPFLFKYDFVLFSMLYLIYGYGLYLSWEIHRKVLPFFIFLSHLFVLVAYTFGVQAGWMGYVSVFSIIVTSVSNQYYRVGHGECNECRML